MLWIVPHYGQACCQGARTGSRRASSARRASSNFCAAFIRAASSSPVTSWPWAGYVLNDSSTREWTLSTCELQRYQNATRRSKRRARARASLTIPLGRLEEARERPEGVDGPGGDQPPDRGAWYSRVAVRT